MSEYQAMFALTPQDMQGRLLDCAGGPSSFNAELTRRGHRVVSCDPLYRFAAEEIEQRIEETYPLILEGAQAASDRYVWTEIASPAELGRLRMRAMRQFLADYPVGKAQGRYVIGELPALPFKDESFDLALCSHFLFTYADQFTADFHTMAIKEMCRVAGEAHVFPLLTMAGEPSPHVVTVMAALRQSGYSVEIRQVEYEFQRGGNKMLRVCR